MSRKYEMRWKDVEYFLQIIEDVGGMLLCHARQYCKKVFICLGISIKYSDLLAGRVLLWLWESREFAFLRLFFIVGRGGVPAQRYGRDVLCL